MLKRKQGFNDWPSEVCVQRVAWMPFIEASVTTVLTLQTFDQDLEHGVLDFLGLEILQY